MSMPELGFETIIATLEVQKTVQASDSALYITVYLLYLRVVYAIKYIQH
jgi:hypothetical protein